MQIMTRENNNSANALLPRRFKQRENFPQISYDIALYAWHFLPVKFFPEYYVYKLCFDLPQNVMWTDE